MDKLKRRMAIAAMMVFAVAFTIISVAAMETPLPADAADKPYCDALEAIQNRYAELKVMAITHDPAMKSRFPQSVDIVKTAGGSKVMGLAADIWALVHDRAEAKANTGIFQRTRLCAVARHRGRRGEAPRAAE